MLSLADWRATRGPLIDIKKRKKHERVMFKLIEFYFQLHTKKPLARILNGYDIMRKFGLDSSPLIGEILKQVNEEQALGHIFTKTEAHRIAKKIISKRKKEKN